MAAEVYEESLALRIGLLEAFAVGTFGDPGYPFPPLMATGAVEEREFLAVVLENPYLRVTIVPALGGRVLRVFDKRSSTEVLPVREALLTVPGGPRGVVLPDGIQFRLTGEDRLNALGMVAHQLDVAGDEEDDAGVWLAESSMAGGLSSHLRISVPPDRAEIHFEARVLNRTLGDLAYNAGLVLEPLEWGIESPRQQVTLAEGGVSRFAEPSQLTGRQVDSWSVKITPTSGLAGASTIAGALEVGSSLRILVSRPLMGAKVLLLTEAGQTLEAPFDLYPETVVDVPLGGLPPKAVAVLDNAGSEVLRWPTLQKSTQPATEYNAGTRHLAHTRWAIDALGEKRFNVADEEFEQALLYNGDDPLLWWAKALTQRKLSASEDRAELPNAHYLAPLEPALRAEAFLSQSSQQGREANPLVKSMSPEDLVEVACLLLEHRLPDEATRWIDEALRHHDLAMLHYLQADALLEGTRMETEAAQHVVLAGRAQLPPYPWRKVETEALRRLSTRFPADERLSILAP